MYQKWQSGKTECFAGISREGLTRKTLAKHNCLHHVLILRIPVICREHASLCGMLTRKLPVKTLQSSICLESSHSLSLSLTQPLQIKTHNIYRVYKIEHNYNQIWHGIKANKNIVVNYNFTISPFAYSVTKPLKQTLELNVSLETVTKLSHT